MTTYRPGNIVLVAFTFTAGERTKRRPALIVLDTGDVDVVLARITTAPYQTPYDVTIISW